MIFWYLKSIGDGFHFWFVDFSMATNDQVLAHFLALVFPTDELDLAVASPLTKPLSRFAAQVVFQLRPGTTVIVCEGDCSTDVDRLRP
jgi:hypothetical protein